MNRPASELSAPPAIEEDEPPDAPPERHSTAAQLAQRLLRLLAPLQIGRLTLHGGEGELLWMSQGRWGPDDESLVQQAGLAFALDGSEPYIERALEHGRRALFFCARTPLGERNGLAFAIAEAVSAQIDTSSIRARVLASMQRYGMSMVPRLKPTTVTPPAAAPVPPAAAVAATPAPLPALGKRSARVSGAALRLRRYARLHAAGTTRRYEIAGEPTSLADDLSRAQRLMPLLQRRGAQGSRTPASFTLPLSQESLLTPQFMQQFGPSIRKAALPEDMLGFSIPTALAAANGAATDAFITQCAAHGCFVALDDFTLTGAGFALLRLSAVRCVKLDSALTANIMSEKFARAEVAAIIKAARVLGLYCVAKDMKAGATARWLGSAGIDYACN